jgi:hypothetical protein
MNTNSYPWLSLLLGALLTISATARSQSAGQDAERGQILVLIDKYAKSVSQADTRLASEIWSTNTEVSFIHPNGHEHAWEQVRTNVYERLMGATFSERKLTSQRPRTRLGTGQDECVRETDGRHFLRAQADGS